MANAHAQEPGSSKEPAPGRTRRWLTLLQSETERELKALLDSQDERALDPRWTRALSLLNAYVDRPAKRLRPMLVFAGYALARGVPAAPTELMRFAASLELLHNFMLIHDDVADQARTRRGGSALHLQLGGGRLGEDLAVVAGDHLFARAVEGMLESGLPRAGEVVRYYLGVCRHTAVGQYLDLELSRTPLAEVTLFQTLKLAQLKTARYGFCAPLVCGARLAGADETLCQTLERAGRHAGIAYQLRDDLIGLFGDPRLSGKPSDCDFEQGKRTFPLIAAYGRADAAGRAELERLWGSEHKGAEELARARELVRAHGGQDATLRAVERATRRARRCVAALPEAAGMREVLDELVASLAGRSA